MWNKVCQGSHLSSTVICAFINDPLMKVQGVGVGIQLNSGESIRGFFADDFVSNSDSSENLQKLCDSKYT